MIRLPYDKNGSDLLKTDLKEFPLSFTKMGYPCYQIGIEVFN
jgi:hypothetical protein